MRDDVYESIVYIINHTKGTKLFPSRECFKVIKDFYPDISDYTMGSIYSAEYMRRMKKNHFKLSKTSEDLHNRYNAAVSEGQPEGIILRMSDEIDLSPALLARLIVQHRYKNELEESTNVPSTKTGDSNSAEGPAIGSSKVQPTIKPVKELLKIPELVKGVEVVDIPSLNHQKATLVVRKTPRVKDSLVETVQNALLNDTKKNINNPSVDSAEEAASINSKANPVNDTLTEKIDKATFSEIKVETANKPELDFIKETVLITNTNIPAVDIVEEAAFINCKANPVTDSLTEKIDKAQFLQTKAEIINEPELDFMKETALITNTNIPALDLAEEAVSIISQTQPVDNRLTEKIDEGTFSDLMKEVKSLASDRLINDFKTELTKNSTLIETEVKIANSRRLKWVEELARFLEEICAMSEVSDEEKLSDSEDPPSKITLLKLMKEPKLIEDPILSAETSMCILQDDQYGPVADVFKHSLGQEFEIRMVRLARAAGLPFSNERGLRTTGFDKTPDIKLDTPIIIDDFIVNWIESKALFGDEATHLDYFKEQYQCYYNRFGSGLVIYWFGFQEKITRRYQDHMMIVEDFPKKIKIPSMRPKTLKVNTKHLERLFS